MGDLKWRPRDDRLPRGRTVPDRGSGPIRGRATSPRETARGVRCSLKPERIEIGVTEEESDAHPLAGEFGEIPAAPADLGAGVIT